MHSASDHYDLIIVGGGLTGLALARALRESRLNILLVDSQTAPTQSSPHFDDRALALSEMSRRMLEKLDLWASLSAEASPIRSIHISDRGQYGRCLLNAESFGFAAFGQVIELRVLGQALWQAVQQQAGLSLDAGTQVIGLEQAPGQTRLHLQTGQQHRWVSADVVLAADGGPSSLRSLAGLPVDVHDYQQTALIANIETALPHDGRAFERFTDTGPLALLPLTRQRLSLVWTLRPEQAQQLSEHDAQRFAHDLQQAFGWRLGKIRRVGSRHRFALSRTRSPIRRQGRLLLMGNAATMLHPIAGQGFNLALRDLMAFADWLQEQQRAALDWRQPAALQQFIERRLADSEQVQDMTHSLVQLFSNQYPLLTHARALSLSLLDSLPALKRHTAVQAMGFRS